MFGVAALVAGAVVIVVQSEGMVTALVLATTVLWLMSTIRHTLMSGAGESDLGSPSLKPAT